MVADVKRAKRIALAMMATALVTMAVPVSGAWAAGPTIVSPSDGASVAYGASVLLKISPEPGQNCSNYNVDWTPSMSGTVWAKFGADCTITVVTGGGAMGYLLGPGSYTWTPWRFCNSLDLSSCPGGANGDRVTGPAGHFTVLTAAAAPALPANPESTASSSDRRAPSVRAFGATLRVNRTGRLAFRVADDSGRASARLTVFAGAGPKKVWSKTYADSTVRATESRYANWRPSTKGSYTFCLVAQDAAGKRSTTSCATIRVV